MIMRTSYRILMFLFFIFFIYAVINAEALNFFVEPNYDLSSKVYKIAIGGLYEAENLEIGSSMYVTNDNMYYDPAHYKYYFGGFFNVKEGYIKLFNNNFTLEAGRFILKDLVDSPYSLFLSGAGLSAPFLLFSYSSQKFFYRTQWILLSRNVPNFDHPDRGAIFKTYGIKVGNLRFAFQDSVVYTNRIFDYEYFLNPIPSFLTQYTLYANKPFYQGWDDSSLMGFFVDYDSKWIYFYAQILIDDFNMNRFYGGFQNPDKVAWSAGGQLKTEFGNIGLYHAGATKYTFEPRTAETGYVLFPESIVTLKDSTRTLLPQENYVGFKYGENSLSFLLTYNNDNLFGGKLYLSMEYVLSGPKSFNNPWQDLSSCPEYTHLLDDQAIEKDTNISVSYSKQVIDGISIAVKLLWTNIENKLEALPAEDEGDYVLKPTNENETNFSIIMGFSWEFDLLKLF